MFFSKLYTMRVEGRRVNFLCLLYGSGLGDYVYLFIFFKRKNIF